MWEVLIFQPIFNLLIAVYALIPGHNLGLALIIFTVITRVVMYPIIKKQLHHAKVMRELQPEIKKIKKEAQGNRQQEAMATMALYKEKGIRPLASIGYLIIQLPVFIALYQGITRIANNPQAVVDHAYSFVADLPFMQQLSADISLFDSTFVGLVDLTEKALSSQGIYWVAVIIILASAITQYLSSKQLIASQGEKKSFRQLMKLKAQGKEVDQADMSSAIGNSTIYLIPGLIVFISLGLAVALPFYWLVNSLIAFLQQQKVLKEGVSETEAIIDGETVSAQVSREPNAKQKRQTTAPNRRQVQANIKTKTPRKRRK